MKIALATGCVVMATTSLLAGPTHPEKFNRHIHLNGVGTDLDAKGSVQIRVSSLSDGTVLKQSFALSVRNLAASTGFKLFVDGVDVFTFGTDAGGGAEVVFSNDPEGQEQPFPPNLTNLTRINLLEVKTLDGLVILVGSPPGHAGGFSSSPSSLV